MKSDLREIIEEVIATANTVAAINSTTDSGAEIHSIETEFGQLIISISRDGLEAEIVTRAGAKIGIDQPEAWSTFYPLKKKMLFYWRIFRSHAEGKLDDRIYRKNET